VSGPAGPAGLPIGVAIGTIGADARWWLDSARRLEAAGYRAVWAWDHLMGRGDPSVPVLEQWSLLSAAAATTTSIRVGTFITNVMKRHPAVLARMAATIQQVGGGRLTVGIGIGGGGREMAAYGLDNPAVPERVARLEEAVAVLRALWTGGPVSLAGHFYPLAEAYAFPRPVPAPPILIAGQTPAGVRLAARIGDGWAAEIAQFAALVPAYLAALEANGRQREEVRIVVGHGGGRSGQDALAGSPWVEAPRDAWAALARAGADEAIVTARTERDVDALVAAAGRWA
jgi:alkanesulfonate monooxygenase SsuD/methylene tetrahydromethanopterin reductase-like flavin-dependent oxidoreductase (luciferase family)